MAPLGWLPLLLLGWLVCGGASSPTSWTARPRIPGRRPPLPPLPAHAQPYRRQLQADTWTAPSTIDCCCGWVTQDNVTCSNFIPQQRAALTLDGSYSTVRGDTRAGTSLFRTPDGGGKGPEVAFYFDVPANTSRLSLDTCGGETTAGGEVTNANDFSLTLLNSCPRSVANQSAHGFPASAVVAFNDDANQNPAFPGGCDDWLALVGLGGTTTSSLQSLIVIDNPAPGRYWLIVDSVAAVDAGPISVYITSWIGNATTPSVPPLSPPYPQPSSCCSTCETGAPLLTSPPTVLGSTYTTKFIMSTGGYNYVLGSKAFTGPEAIFTLDIPPRTNRLNVSTCLVGTQATPPLTSYDTVLALFFECPAFGLLNPTLVNTSSLASMAGQVAVADEPLPGSTCPFVNAAELSIVPPLPGRYFLVLDTVSSAPLMSYGIMLQASLEVAGANDTSYVAPTAAVQFASAPMCGLKPPVPSASPSPQPSPSVSPSRTPTPAPGSFVGTALGAFSGFALASNGRLVPFGAVEGPNLTPPSALQQVLTAPVTAPGAARLLSLCLGASHACAVTVPRAYGAAAVNGSLQCWGAGSLATPPPPLDTATDIQEVACGSHHACVLRNNGSVACFGANSLGQATPPAALVSAAAPGTSTTLLAQHVYAAAAYSCAVLGNTGAVGTVLCWGDSPVPNLAAGLTALAPTVALALGGNRACAWDGSGAGRLTPVCLGTQSAVADGLFPPFTATPWLQICSGAAHGCGLLAGGGGVACWGSNRLGQTSVPASATGANVTAISCGWYSTCATFRPPGGFVCWGGQFGVPLGANSKPPVYAAVVASPRKGGGEGSTPPILISTGRTAAGIAVCTSGSVRVASGTASLNSVGSAPAGLARGFYSGSVTVASGPVVDGTSGIVSISTGSTSGTALTGSAGRVAVASGLAYGPSGPVVMSSGSFLLLNRTSGSGGNSIYLKPGKGGSIGAPRGGRLVFMPGYQVCATACPSGVSPCSMVSTRVQGGTGGPVLEVGGGGSSGAAAGITLGSPPVPVSLAARAGIRRFRTAITDVPQPFSGSAKLAIAGSQVPDLTDPSAVALALQPPTIGNPVPETMTYRFSRTDPFVSTPTSIELSWASPVSGALFYILNEWNASIVVTVAPNSSLVLSKPVSVDAGGLLPLLVLPSRAGAGGNWTLFPVGGY